MPVLLVIFLLAFHQPAYELVANIKAPGEQYYTDPFGNIYITNAGEIRRYNNEFHETARYSNPSLGKISAVDLSDPLRILLFYKEYNQVLWLDRYLAEIRSPVLLDQLGYEYVPVVCSSSQGGFWLYDEIICQLCYLDNNMNTVHKSVSLRSMLGSSERPVSLLEKNRQIYLNIPDKGIFLFDMYGNYLKLIPLTGCQKFQVTDTDIFYFKNDSLFKYNIEYDSLRTIELPVTTHPVHAEVQPGFLYIFTGEAFRVYKYHKE